MAKSGIIRTGIGGWTFKPWRGTFYPKGLRQADELHHAANHVGAIEINGTYYRLQKPESFAKWRDAAPDGFKFTIKASRYCTNRKDLRDTGESIERFCNQGIAELGDRLGPIFWQFMATKKFDADEFEAFIEMLPRQWQGVGLRHAVDVRHESFICPEFVALMRKHGVAIVCPDSDKFLQIADQTADFSYARLMRCREDIDTGYSAAELDHWAHVAQSWHGGTQPDGLDYAADASAKLAQKRDVFMFFISGAKVRAPAAASALTQRLEQ